MGTLQTELRKGSSGQAVTTIQNALIRWGYRLRPDGKYGTGTQSAVRSFQIHRCLLPTGIVDQGTLDALQATRPTHPAGGLQNPVPRANRQNLFDLAASIDPCVHQAAFMAQFRPTPGAVSAPVNAFCLSQKGCDFIYKLETYEGISERLHWPGGASGVTLGPGYDMKERGSEEIIRDLMAIGVDREVAKKVGKAGGLDDPKKAKAFADKNHNLITLTPAQQMQLLKNKAPHYEAIVKRNITTDLFQFEYDALVSFAYNPGGSIIPVARQINSGQIDEAMKAIRMRTRSGGKELKALVERRKAEISLYLYGQYHHA